jgi:heme/copper-type cytochrome/quinol oxidase subunit 4
MLEEMASEAVRMLIILFGVTIAFMIVWGALWIRACKKLK